MWKLCTGMFSGKVGKWEIVTRGTTGVLQKIEGDKGPIVLWKNNFKEKADWARNGMERLQEGIDVPPLTQQSTQEYLLKASEWNSG